MIDEPGEECEARTGAGDAMIGQIKRLQHNGSKVLTTNRSILITEVRSGDAVEGGNAQ